LTKYQGLWPDGNTDSPGNQPGEFQASLSDYDKNFLEQYNAPNWTAFVNEIPIEEPPYYPLWQRTWISEAAGEAESLMGSITGEYVPKLIMCDPADFDAIWAEYVAKYDAVDKVDWLASHDAWIQKYGWVPR
jgi:putative aldouronate transport system substrate-binding protein